MADDSDTDSGFKRPPSAGQFRPGQSGNPRGRPKGSRNFATAFQAELQSQIFVNENGVRRKITKREAIAKQLVNKAASGDPRAIPLVLNEMRLHESKFSGDVGQGIFDTPEDHRVMESIVQRIKAAARLEAGSSSTADLQPPEQKQPNGHLEPGPDEEPSG